MVDMKQDKELSIEQSQDERLKALETQMDFIVRKLFELRYEIGLSNDDIKAEQKKEGKT